MGDTLAAHEEDNQAYEIDWKDVRPSRTEIAVGGAMIAVWAILFAIGLSVPGGDFREIAVRGFSDIAHAATQPRQANITFGYVIWCIVNVIVAGFSYTISNVFLLTLAAAFLGCMTRRWATRFVDNGSDTQLIQEKKSLEQSASESSAQPEDSHPPKAKPKIQADREEREMREVRRAYLSAVLRSLLLYFTTIAGYFVLMPENSLSISPGQYVRLAGAISAVAFLVGHEPKSLMRLFQLIALSKNDSAPEHDRMKEINRALVRIEELQKQMQDLQGIRKNSPQSVASASAPAQPQEPQRHADGVGDAGDADRVAVGGDQK